MSEYVVYIPDGDKVKIIRNGFNTRVELTMQQREEIVRCKNCAYICYREYANGLALYTCSYFDSEHAEVNPNGFCAWGVRKEVDE